MGLSLYMDVHVPMAITAGLRSRGIDVLTSQEDGTRRFSDEKLLDRSTSFSRLLFSQDSDCLRLAANRQQLGIDFCGVAFAPQEEMSIGKLIDDLELVAECYTSGEVLNRVIYLPLK
ncbi:MAG: DUF5615 family PIN-like protein [Pirellulales bacterium]